MVYKTKGIYEVISTIQQTWWSVLVKTLIVIII